MCFVGTRSRVNERDWAHCWQREAAWLMNSFFLPLSVSSSFFFLLLCSSHEEKNRRQTQEGGISEVVSGCETRKQTVTNKRAFFLQLAKHRDALLFCFYCLCEFIHSAVPPFFTEHKEQLKTENTVDNKILRRKKVTFVVFLFIFHSEEELHCSCILSVCL